MLEIRKGDLFESGCLALVNTCNCVGVMGKGVAAAFKNKYPDMFTAYRVVCALGKLSPGNLHVWHEPSGIFIINFPTKTHWKLSSEYRYITLGLDAMNKVVEDGDMKSIAFPSLGCGLGGLHFDKVLGMIKDHHDVYWQDRLIVVYEPYNC